MSHIASVNLSPLAVSLPVILDVGGRLTAGVTSDLSVHSVTVSTPTKFAHGTTLSIQLCIARNFAYMQLVGEVASVEQEPAPFGRDFRVCIVFHKLAPLELSVLDSCITEIRASLGRLDSPSATGLALPDKVTKGIALENNPRGLLSLFITDNPHPLTQVNGSGWQAEPVGRANNNEPLGENPHPNLSLSTFNLIFQLVRDKIVQLLPYRIASDLIPQASFAFIAHPRDLRDVPRKFPFARYLPDWLIRLWFRYQWPFVASYVTGIKQPDGQNLRGVILISPLTTSQMLENPHVARKRVLQTARFAESMGVKVIGLGAFTSILTNDGHDLVGKIRAKITTGNSLSAGIAVENALAAAAATNLSIPHCTAAIIGAAGSVGSACAQILAQLVRTLILVDCRKGALEKLAKTMNSRATIKTAISIEAISRADIIITATSSPSAIVFPRLLKSGAIVVDAAQPKNVSEQVPSKRDDVMVIESAILHAPEVDCHFDLGLGPSEALGCLSEAMVLAAVDWKDTDSVGKPDPQQVGDILGISRRLGLRLAFFRNSLGYVTEKDIRRVSEQRAKAEV